MLSIVTRLLAGCPRTCGLILGKDKKCIFSLNVQTGWWGPTILLFSAYWGGREKHTRFYLQNLMGRDHLEVLDIDLQTVL